MSENVYSDSEIVGSSTEGKRSFVIRRGWA
jgi:hypothetical protein